MVTLRFLAVLLFLCVGSVAFATQGISPKEAKEQVLLLKMDTDKELARKDIEALERRIDDQVSRVADISASVDRFGILLTGFGFLITVALASLGLLGYFSVASRAREQAEATAKQYFDDNAASFRKEIDSLREKAKHAHGQIDDQVNDLQTHADAAKQVIQTRINQSSSAAKPPARDAEALEKVAEQLKKTPEAGYMFKDWDTRAYAAYQAGQLDEAALYWKRAAETPDAIPAAIARALCNRGVVLGELGRVDEEIAAYELVENRYRDDPSPELREQVAEALFNKGATLGKLGRDEEEIAAYDLLENRYHDDSTTELREVVARALYNKGVTLGKLGRDDEEIAVYDLVESRFHDDPAPGLREQVAQSLVNKGASLAKLGRDDDAIAAYDLVEIRYRKDPALGLRGVVAAALINKGVSLAKLGQDDEEIYDLVEGRYRDDPAPGMREYVAIARNGKGFCLLLGAKKHWPQGKERRLSEARVFLELALVGKPQWGMALGNLAYVAWLQGDVNAAEMQFRIALRSKEDAGEKLYKETLDDIALHTVQPDEGFKVLVERLFKEWRQGQPS